jgi:hypothetical protein
LPSHSSGGWSLGSHFTGRLDEHQLTRAIAVVLVVSGTAMAVQAIVG